jgi:hypothetical protein
MINKSNVKIGDVQYYHPFPSRNDSSQCWNFFRCRLDVDYKSLQDVYCLRCCKKLKSKPGEEIKYSFYTLKWQQGYATSHLMKHVNQSHAGDMKSQADSESVSAAQSTRQSRITEARVSVMSKTQRDSITKDLVRNMVFEDKEPYSVFERPGFRKCIERLNPAYNPPNRVTVAAICERLFKAGGQVLTSARLRLLGSRVEAVLMTNFNSQLADAAR